MLSLEENQNLTQVGPGTPCGEMLRALLVAGGGVGGCWRGSVGRKDAGRRGGFVSRWLGRGRDAR